MPAKFVISSIYKAVDKHTSVIKRMESAQMRFTSKSEAGFARMERSARRFTQTIDRGLKRFDRLARIVLLGGITATGLGIRKMINEAAKIEDAAASFTPLLGSVSRANQLVEKLNKTAATTPFEFEAISDVASQLLPMMNGDIERTIKLFRMLGDTAGGKVTKLESITRGYVKILGKGRADMEALNMITDAGVPIMDQLSKMYGVSIAKLYDMSRQGKITADDITKVFQIMTSEGGIFFKGMEISSRTWNGLLSTMRDNIKLVFAAFGEQMLPTLKEYQKLIIQNLQKLRDWINTNQELIKQKVDNYINTIVNVIKFLINNSKILIKTIKIIIGLFISLKVISLATSTAIIILKTVTVAYNLVLGTQAALFGTLTRRIALNKVALTAYSITTGIAKGAIIGFTAVLGALKTVFIAVNAVMIANPIGAIITGVTLLIIGIILLIKHWDKVKAKIDEFSNSAIFQILSIMFPIIKILELIAFMQDRWDAIKQAFKVEGFLAGLKAIGKALLSFVVKPIEVLLKTIGRIPGMKFAARGAERIGAFRGGFDENLLREPIKTEEKEKVNIVKTQTDIQTERFEEIRQNQLGIELTNRTDKDVNIKANPALIPITTNTQIQ